MQCTSHFAQLVHILKAHLKVVKNWECPRFLLESKFFSDLVHEPGAPVALQPFP